MTGESSTWPRVALYLSVVATAMYGLANMVGNSYFASAGGDEPVAWIQSTYGPASAWADVAVLAYGMVGAGIIFVLYAREHLKWRAPSASSALMAVLVVSIGSFAAVDAVHAWEWLVVPFAGTLIAGGVALLLQFDSWLTTEVWPRGALGARGESERFGARPVRIPKSTSGPPAVDEQLQDVDRRITDLARVIHGIVRAYPPPVPSQSAREESARGSVKPTAHTGAEGETVTTSIRADPSAGSSTSAVAVPTAPRSRWRCRPCGLSFLKRADLRAHQIGCQVRLETTETAT